MEEPRSKQQLHPEPVNTRPEITRRDFVKAGAAATALGAATLACKQGSLTSVAELTFPSTGSLEESIVRTTCAMCPNGCGLEVRVVSGKATKVEGNALHPLNQGVCCLKAQASLEVLYSPERLEHPRLRTGDRRDPASQANWKEISWDEALTLLANKLDELRKAGQAHTVALMHGETRGQMRALMQRFMQAYGSPNLISRESLGEGAARLGMLLSQGINGLPVYDLNNCNYAITFGGNLLESSRSVISYLGSAAFMRRGRPQRGKLVAVHPRLSLTGVKADEWVPIRPGTYAALALGMANVIINSQLYDESFVRDFTFGFEDFEDENGQVHKGFKSLVLEEYTLEHASLITGVSTDIIARLAGEFATNRPAVAIMPAETGELNSGNSLYTALAIHALNALVGSIDAQGGVWVQRFPDVAAWPDYAQDALGKQSLGQERLDGAGTASLPLASSAYHQVARRILEGQPYPVNLLMLLNANPVYDIPDNGQLARALMQVPFVVSFSSIMDESAAHADLILPASTFLEVWGDDYMEGTGYPGVSLRQPVVAPVHDTRDPADVLLNLAQRLGGSLSQALPWEDYRALVEHRLSGIDMDWEKYVSNGFWAQLVYFNAQPSSQAWGEVVGRDRLNAPKDGRFDFFSRELFSLLGKMQGKSPDDLDCLPHFNLPTSLSEKTQEASEYPFLLITQALITQSQNWPGVIPTLQESYGLQVHTKWSSWVELNHLAAEALELKDDDLVWVESPSGRVQAIVRVYDGIWPNAVFMPAGMGHFTTVRWGAHSPEKWRVGANPNELMQTASEPLCGQAVFNPTRVRIYRS
ncbi:MAG: molybdopterin-dependent oxidoreductase [Chloroflexota bacterium]